MSLIFEALKKLDREKQIPERGFVVVAQAPWPAGRGKRLGRMALGGALILLLVLGAYFLLRSEGSREAARPGTTLPTSLRETALPPPGKSPEPPAKEVPATAPQAQDLREPSRRPTAALPAPARPIWEGRPSPPPADHPMAPAASETSPPRTDGPSLAPDTGGEALQLQAISEQDGQPVAMLSGRLVREGDSFEGVRIVRIGPAEVEIEVQGRRRVLRF